MAGSVGVNTYLIPLEFCNQMVRFIQHITELKDDEILDKVTIESQSKNGKPEVRIDMLITKDVFGLESQGHFHTKMVAEKLMLNDFLERHDIGVCINSHFDVERAGKEKKGYKKVSILAWQT